MFTTGGTVGLTERIIDDTCLVSTTVATMGLTKCISDDFSYTRFPKLQ